MSEKFADLRRVDDPVEILSAHAEGLHAYRRHAPLHLLEASGQAVQLAQELVTSQPNLLLDLHTHTTYF